jgi:hypothetical protein
MNYKRLNEILGVEDDGVEIVDEGNYVHLSSSRVMFGKLNPMSNPLVKEAHAIRMKELAKEEEWKKKLLSAIRSDEYRQKMREIVTGRKHSEETKQRMSEIHKQIGTGKFNLGVPKSEDTKKRMSESALVRERFPCCKCGKGFTKANIKKHENSCSGKPK